MAYIRLTDSYRRLLKETCFQAGFDPNNRDNLSHQLGCDGITIHRTTLAKILDGRDWVNPNKVRQLCRWLNDKLCHADQEIPYPETEGKDFIRKPQAVASSQVSTNRSQLRRSPRATSPPSAITKNQSICQQVAEKLWTLDYREQERQFEDVRDRQQLATTTCIETIAPYDSWILKRLVQKLPAWDPHTCLELNLSKFDTVDCLWEHWEHRLESLPYWSKENNPQAAVLEALGIAAHEKSVVLILHGARNKNLKAEDLVNALETVIESFWHPLVEKTEKIRKLNSEGRLFLFITQCLGSSLPHIDCHLTAPQNIPSTQVSAWFNQHRLYDLLEEACGSDRCSKVRSACREWEPMQDADQSQFEGIDEMFSFVCDAFALGGVTDFEQYWKLAGQDRQAA